MRSDLFFVFSLFFKLLGIALVWNAYKDLNKSNGAEPKIVFENTVLPSIKVASQSCYFWNNVTNSALYTPQSLTLTPSQDMFQITNVSPLKCQFIPVRNSYQDLSRIKIRLIGNSSSIPIQVENISFGSYCFLDLNNTLICNLESNGTVTFQTLDEYSFCFGQYLQGPFLNVQTSNAPVTTCTAF